MKFSDKHWLAVAFFVIMIIIVQIIVSSPAFGATFVYNVDGERKVECSHLSEEDYVKLVMAYNEGRLDFVNYRDCSNTWWHFVNKATSCHMWLTKEEGIEMAFYLEHMFNTTW